MVNIFYPTVAVCRYDYCYIVGEDVKGCIGSELGAAATRGGMSRDVRRLVAGTDVVGRMAECPEAQGCGRFHKTGEIGLWTVAQARELRLELVEGADCLINCAGIFLRTAECLRELFEARRIVDALLNGYSGSALRAAEGASNLFETVVVFPFKGFPGRG